MTEPEAVRAAALAVPGVAGMHPGRYGTAATFSASGRVWGVRLAPGRVEVHVVAEAHHALTALGHAVQESVRRALPEYAGEVVVHIEDLSAPSPTPDPHEDAPGAGLVERIDHPRRIP